VLLCGTIEQGCATPGGGQVCQGSNCCSICQTWGTDQNPGAACLGKFDSANVEGGKLSLHYSHGDPVPPPGPPDPGPRIAVVRLKCGTSDWANPTFIDAGSKDFNGEYLYEIDADSKYACSLLSGGTIFLIILIVLIVVYIVAGLIYNKVRHDKVEFPNLDFWKDAPFLATGGCKFLAFKLSGGRIGSDYQTVA